MNGADDTNGAAIDGVGWSVMLIKLMIMIMIMFAVVNAWSELLSLPLRLTEYLTKSGLVMQLMVRHYDKGRRQHMLRSVSNRR